MCSLSAVIPQVKSCPAPVNSTEINKGSLRLDKLLCLLNSSSVKQDISVS